MGAPTLNIRVGCTVYPDVDGGVPGAAAKVTLEANAPANPPDEDRAQPGDREAAFRELARTRLDRAFGLAWHLLGNAGDAEDACQEALTMAWRSLARLRDAAHFDAWFDRILVNVCLEHLRHRARRPTVPLTIDTDLASDDPIDASLDRDLVGRALQRLSPEQRAVVVLRYWADLSTEAIADRLDVPAGTVRSRLHYALETLRGELSREEAIL